MAEWSETRFSQELNWWTYAMDWRNIVVAECRRQEADAFAGENKFRVALIRTTYFAVRLQALMVLIDRPRNVSVFAAFPVYVGMVEGQLSRMLSLSPAAAAVSIPVQRDPSAYVDPIPSERQSAEEAAARAQLVANRLGVRFTSLNDPNGDPVQVYFRELPLSEDELLLADAQTFTPGGVEQLEGFARAVLESAYEFMVVREPDTISALQIEVQQASATATEPSVKPASAAVTGGQPRTPTTSTPASSSGGCYVATAVYGSYDCPEVRILRRWRDAALLPRRFGRSLVRTYYTVSPALVRTVGTRRWFVTPARRALNALVGLLRRSGIEDGPYRDLLKTDR